MNKSCNASSERSEVEEVEEAIRSYMILVDVVLVFFVNIAGYTGNVLTFLVLLRDRAASRSTKSTNFILRALSLSDFCFLACSLPVQLMKTLGIVFNLQIAVMPHVLPYVFYAGHAARMLRNWTVVLVSVERWVAIFWPLRAQLVCTVRNARISVAVIVGVALAYNVPRFFEALPGPTIECVNGTNIENPEKLEVGFGIPLLRKSMLYRYVYKTALYTIFVIGGPVAILIVLNVLLVLGIRKATRMQASLIPSSRPKSQLTASENACKAANSLQSTPNRQYFMQNSPRFKASARGHGMGRGSRVWNTEDRPIIDLSPTNENEPAFNMNMHSLNSEKILEAEEGEEAEATPIALTPNSEKPITSSNRLQVRKRCTIQEPIRTEQLAIDRPPSIGCSELQETPVGSLTRGAFSQEIDSQLPQTKSSTLSRPLLPTLEFQECENEIDPNSTEPTIAVESSQYTSRQRVSSRLPNDSRGIRGGGLRPASVALNISSTQLAEMGTERCPAHTSQLAIPLAGGNGGCAPAGGGGNPPPLPSSSSSQSRARNMSKTRNEVTRLCIAVIGVYICCELPPLVNQLLQNLEVPARVIAFMVPTSNLFVTINSAVNFYIYVFLGKRFRHILLQMLCHRGEADRSGRWRMSHYSCVMHQARFVGAMGNMSTYASTAPKRSSGASSTAATPAGLSVNNTAAAVANVSAVAVIIGDAEVEDAAFETSDRHDKTALKMKRSENGAREPEVQVAADNGSGTSFAPMPHTPLTQNGTSQSQQQPPQPKKNSSVSSPRSVCHSNSNSINHLSDEAPELCSSTTVPQQHLKDGCDASAADASSSSLFISDNAKSPRGE